MTRVGIIGAGNIGSALARGLVERGFEVVIANSRGPETLSSLVGELGERARAATATEAAEQAEWAIVTVPLKAVADLPVAELDGKVVLDTNNYYPGRDGSIAELDEKRITTSEIVQRHLAGSRVVKAFNHILAGDILTAGRPQGAEGRRALAASSDDNAALDLVTELYDSFGFDTVVITPLSESWRIERDTPAYGVAVDTEQLRDGLARAER